MLMNAMAYRRAFSGTGSLRNISNTRGSSFCCVSVHSIGLRRASVFANGDAPAAAAKRATPARIGQAIPLYRFDSQGNYWRERLSKRALVEASGLHARDLIVIDTGFHRTARPALLVREEAFLISLAHIRAIVRHDSVFLLHPDSPGVQDFAARLSGWLKGSGFGSPFLTDPHLPSRHAAFTDGVLMEETTASSGFGDEYAPEDGGKENAVRNNSGFLPTMLGKREGAEVQQEINKTDRSSGGSKNNATNNESNTISSNSMDDLENGEPNNSIAERHIINEITRKEQKDKERHSESPPTEPRSVILPGSAVKVSAVPPPGPGPAISGSRGYRHAESSQLAFESKVLESVLSTVCQQCDDRLVLISPLVKTVLDSLNTRSIDPEVLHQLLPMKDVLSQFEIESTLMRNVLNELLHNDEDMVRMLLTERRTRKVVPLAEHHKVELLLENYCSQLVGIAQEAYYLRKRVESTQSIVELRLDAYRNYMLRINVQLAIASISLASGTVLAGFFGMNLTSGLENEDSMFMLATGGCLFGMSAMFLMLNTRIKGLIPKAGAIDPFDSVFNNLDEIQHVLTLVRHGSERPTRITREEFRTLLRQVQGTTMSAEQVDMIFNIFGIESSGDDSRVQEKVKNRLRLSRSYTDLVDFTGGSGESDSSRGGKSSSWM